MKLKYVFSVTVACATAFSAFADIAISDVNVFSGYPWKEVVIGCKITGTNDAPMALQCRAKDNDTGKTYECSTLEDVDLSEGVHAIKWNAESDNVKFKSTNVVFSLRLIYPTYCVIDLSGGTSATHYAVSYLENVPVGGWTDEYKTTKLVMRRVEAGTDPLGRYTLTQPYYIGVFEVTQRQYELVVGCNNSYCKGPLLPVNKISWVETRGYDYVDDGWPLTEKVSNFSFVGIVQAKTGLCVDLPTVAQWQFACRAGTDSYYNNGGNDVDNMNLLGRFYDGSGFAAVGSYYPNAWGIYDMHGNVNEWCLDHAVCLSGTDPVGPLYGDYRILCGGNFLALANF